MYSFGTLVGIRSRHCSYAHGRMSMIVTGLSLTQMLLSTSTYFEYSSRKTTFHVALLYNCPMASILAHPTVVARAATISVRLRDADGSRWSPAVRRRRSLYNVMAQPCSLAPMSRLLACSNVWTNPKTELNRNPHFQVRNFLFSNVRKFK